jgi:NADP-dependent 3-hydroxy acid dehydrogenase YdfG
VDPVELGKLRSLGEIIDRLRATTGAPVPAPVAPEPAPVAPAPPVEVGPDLERLVLDVVADKTGYPAEMLAGHMELEADLGIDSIKRVEILSAVRRSAPDLPEVDPVELGKLRSLGEIIDRLRATTGTSTDEDDRPVEVEFEPTGLARHAVGMVEAAAPGFALPGLRGGPLAVTDDGHGVAAQVVSRLAAAGIKADVYQTVPSDVHGVIHLGGLGDIASVDAALAVQRDAFGVARAVAGRFAESGGVFVTVQDTGGDFGTSGRYPDRAWLGGLAGLTRTAGREWPAVSVKAIDCERGNRTSAAIADAIVRELLHGGSTVDVGLRADGTRNTVEAVVTEVDADPGARIGPDSVIVATGGARGVTAEALRALAQAYRPKLVLIGRTPLTEEPAHLAGVTDEASLRRAVVQHATRATGKPPLPAAVNAEVATVLAARDVAATVAAIRAAGSEVRYVAVDARDGAALTTALDGVRREWGPITGVVHGAGVIADKRIEDKTDDQFDKVFDTKVAGLRALLDATAGDPLTVLSVFSSISAYAGNPGQCDYAMANEVLNQVAHAERVRRPGCLVRSIAWGPWEGGMVSPALAEHFRHQGVPLIPVGSGARAFVAELTGTPAGTHVVVTAGPLDRGGASTGEIQINAVSHPYLADHTIEGTPVVPVAMALEWLTAAARGWSTGPGPAVIQDVGVLRRIGLERFANGGDRLAVHGTRDDGAQLNLEIRGDGDTRHYRAKARLDATVTPAQWTVPTDLEPVRPDVYDGRVLFHGPRFQAIREVEGISAAGAAGVLTGAYDLGWNRAAWQTDPAAVDGGLQLAVLWAKQVMGRATLPMGVAEYRVYQAGLHDGPTRCVVRARDVWSDGAECDIAFLAEDGTVRAELLGVSLVSRPA